MTNTSNSHQEVVIFLHIPKTAGTTLYDVLKQQYKKNNILTIHGIVEENIEKFQDKYYQNQSTVRLIRGHMTYGLHKILDCPYAYITVLRNPVSRIISVYYYLLQSQSHPQHHLVKGKTLAEFVSSGTAHNNGQTRFIAGKYNSSDRGQPINLLERAKNNLKENFTVVGLTERFDESLMLLKRQLGWVDMPFYVKQNKSKKPAQLTITEDTVTLIQNHNFFDVELYQYAQEIFEYQLSLLDNCFENDLNRFLLLNKIYQPIGQVYSKARSLMFRFKPRNN
jgi:hypothetical protein